MIQFNKQDGDRILEIGAGKSPHPQADVVTDCRPGEGIHFPMDLEATPWPLTTGEFSHLFGSYCLEHCSYPNIPAILKEMHRVLRPNGFLVLLVPNTESQLLWIQGNQNGWDGKSFFESASENLFGTQRVGSENGPDVHKCFFSPNIIHELFSDAGFVDIQTMPYGSRQTDMVIEAKKPAETIVIEAKTMPFQVKVAPEFMGYSNPDVLEAPAKELDNPIESLIAEAEQNLSSHHLDKGTIPVKSTPIPVVTEELLSFDEWNKRQQQSPLVDMNVVTGVNMKGDSDALTIEVQSETIQVRKSPPVIPNVLGTNVAAMPLQQHVIEASKVDDLKERVVRPFAELVAEQAKKESEERAKLYGISYFQNGANGGY